MGTRLDRIFGTDSGKSASKLNIITYLSFGVSSSCSGASLRGLGLLTSRTGLHFNLPFASFDLFCGTFFEVIIGNAGPLLESVNSSAFQDLSEYLLEFGLTIDVYLQFRVAIFGLMLR